MRQERRRDTRTALSDRGERPEPVAPERGQGDGKNAEGHRSGTTSTSSTMVPYITLMNDSDRRTSSNGKPNAPTVAMTALGPALQGGGDFGAETRPQSPRNRLQAQRDHAQQRDAEQQRDQEYAVVDP